MKNFRRTSEKHKLAVQFKDYFKMLEEKLTRLLYKVKINQLKQERALHCNITKTLVYMYKLLQIVYFSNCIIFLELSVV